MLRQSQLDGARTQAQRNKLGQFATPPTLAADILKYASMLLPSDIKIRFLDPALVQVLFTRHYCSNFRDRKLLKQSAMKLTPITGTKRLSFGVTLRYI